MTGRSTTERILDAYLAPAADRLPDRVIDAALSDIARTPQRRALRVPWRFPTMPALSRATGIAAVALVAVVGAGAIYLNGRAPGGPGGPPSASATPTTAPTAVPSAIAWSNYVSGVHGFTVGYPADWSVAWSASRDWRPGDGFPGDGDVDRYADAFQSPDEGDGTLGLFVWEMPSEGADLSSTAGLTSWAESFCTAAGAPGCEDFAGAAVPIGRPADSGNCGPAILVPTAEAQYAFFRGCGDALLSVGEARIVVLARPDGFPAAARYGGTVKLLEALLPRMSGWALTPPRAT
jgi:hypothetical protein